MKFRPEGAMEKAYQRDRRTYKEDNKAALAQETDGCQMTMSRLRSSHDALLTPSIRESSQLLQGSTVQAGTSKVYRNYINSDFSVNNKGNPVIYFH